MSANKIPKDGALIAITTVFITQAVLNSIGKSKIGIVIDVTFLIIVGIIVAVILIRYRNKGIGPRLNITASIIVLLTCLLIGTTLIMNNFYPQFGDTHKILSTALNFSAIGSGLIFFIFISIVGFIFTKNNR
jgi:hypothetical protein